MKYTATDGLLCVIDGVHMPPLHDAEAIGQITTSILGYITDTRDASAILISATPSKDDHNLYLNFYRAFPHSPSYNEIAETFHGMELPGGGTLLLVGRESILN